MNWKLSRNTPKKRRKGFNKGFWESVFHSKTPKKSTRALAKSVLAQLK